MQVGDKVKNKSNGIIAEVAWSSFGFSLHWYSEKGFHKTLGTPAHELLEHWELITNKEEGI